MSYKNSAPGRATPSHTFLTPSDMIPRYPGGVGYFAAFPGTTNPAAAYLGVWSHTGTGSGRSPWINRVLEGDTHNDDL